MQQFLKQMTLSVLTFKVRNYRGKCFHAANQIWLSHFVRNEDSLIIPFKQHPCLLFISTHVVCVLWYCVTTVSGQRKESSFPTPTLGDSTFAYIQNQKHSDEIASPNIMILTMVNETDYMPCSKCAILRRS